MNRTFQSDPQALCDLRLRAEELGRSGGLTPDHRQALRRQADAQGLPWEECEVALAGLPDAPPPRPPLVRPSSGGDGSPLLVLLMLLSLKFGPAVWDHFHPKPMLDPQSYVGRSYTPSPYFQP